MKANVRAGARDDIPRLMELANESAGAAHWSKTDYENLFAPKLVQQSCLLVAETGGIAGGFLVARGLDGDWEIENIVVTPGLRRQGLGTGLMQAFLRHTGQIPIKTVHLEVRESNSAAQQLYKSLGFAHVGRRKSYYSAPAEDAIVLKLSF